MIFTEFMNPEIAAALKPYFNALKNSATDIVGFTSADDLLEFSKMVMPSGSFQQVDLEGEELSKVRETLKMEGVSDADEATAVKELFQVPNDIVIANTIPLKQLDVEIENGMQEDSSERFRICIHDTVTVLEEHDGVPMDQAFTIKATVPLDHIRSYIENTDFDVDNTLFIIGSIRHQDIASIERTDTTALIMMRNDCMYVGNHFYDKITLNDLVHNRSVSFPEYMDQAYDHNENVFMGLIIQTEQMLSHAITAFYSINAALLNPVIMEVYNNKTSRIPDRSVTAKKATKRGKIRYVKRHLISTIDIDKAFEKRGFVRKAMIWYVTGHWREYKSGKKVFIQGYWKGALRNMKDEAFANLEARERDIVTKDENGKEIVYETKKT